MNATNRNLIYGTAFAIYTFLDATTIVGATYRLKQDISQELRSDLKHERSEALNVVGIEALLGLYFLGKKRGE